MKSLKAVLAVLLTLFAAPVAADPSDICAVPSYMLVGGALDRVQKVVGKEKKLVILVVGTTSATLPGPDGARAAFPARLEAALKRRLPSVTISLVAHTKPRHTAAAMASGLENLLIDVKPNLVVWQTGTYDAVQGVDPEDFRASVAEGVETLRSAGADVVLMNMQYSPRTESMLAISAYADNLQWVAREREVPLFDRLSIMRHWNDAGAMDLYKATKDLAMAQRVHDCIGRALASLIIDAARLETLEAKAPQ
jgi:hypothetical protein